MQDHRRCRWRHGQSHHHDPRRTAGTTRSAVRSPACRSDLKANGAPIFDWLAAHPQEASLFGETMIGFHGAEPAAVAAAYDFSGCKTIVDVGGGTGNLITTILAAQPAPRGVLFDLPHVVPI